jgi:hypothetical protein
VHDGSVSGTLLLRHRETWEVTGAASVSGTVVTSGSAQVVETGEGYRDVTDVDHYDVSLTSTTATGQWSGTWHTTHETNRSRSVVPPKAL